MSKLYKFSVTVGTEEGTCVICTETKNESIYFAEFINYDDACDYLNKCYEIVEERGNYTIYKKKGLTMKTKFEEDKEYDMAWYIGVDDCENGDEAVYQIKELINNPDYAKEFIADYRRWVEEKRRDMEE